ncbi:MFS transporter [Burkholderia sp. WAC0059]|uniref:MFS transporter n=1 Tax=Burkholderia sp. WAC0059 TaxID=2066022 RepID=UPI0015E0E9A2|nr:MFS transporter [Burkholderia sp. WAC0059]
MSNRRSAEMRSLLHVVFASFAGSTIEWYDFSVFSASSALVFNRIFFANFSPLVGLLLSLLTYAVGYVVRPLGGVVFGHFGDRIGRKPVLIVTFLMMGSATILMGLLPTYATIGVAAPLLLAALRIVQGLALGGEYGGAALLVTENCPPNRRGLFSSSALIGLAAGSMLGTAVFGVFSALPRAEFMDWGWRVPFLLSLVLVVIGLWIRTRVDETPDFKRVERTKKVHKLPILEVLRNDMKRVLLVCGARAGETMQYNVVAVFALHYATHARHIAPAIYLSAISLSSLLSIVVMPLSGALSDRIGRRPVGRFAGITAALFGAAFIPMIHTGAVVWVTLAVVLMLGISAGIGNSLPSAYFPELFDAPVRYTAVSLGYQLGTVAGGLTPAITTVLFMYFGITAIGAYLVISGLLVLFCFVMLPETLGKASARTVETVRE